jgi:cobalt-zinc-cadmium efflux system protein
MGVGHGHHRLNYSLAFGIGIALNIIFVVIEIIYGLMANSSALLADAGHNTSDVLSLIFAWGASVLAGRKPKGRFTYGLRRTTIYVSIFNALLLFAAVGAIGWDAFGKIKNPEPVAGNQVMIVAGIGVVINTVTALLFMRGQKDDLNVKGAFLHMTADAAVSLGVVIAGLLIRLTGNYWIDPLMSFVIIIVILWGTIRLFIDSVNLALDAVPKDIDLEEVNSYLLSVEGVEDVHDLHIWAMSTTENALSAHLLVPVPTGDQFLIDIQNTLSREFNIDHVTIQIEKSADNPEQCNNCN